jgi:hypothetical protein
MWDESILDRCRRRVSNGKEVPEPDLYGYHYGPVFDVVIFVSLSDLYMV